MKLRILTTVIAALLLTAGAAACAPEAGTHSVAMRSSGAGVDQVAQQLPRNLTFENRMGTALVAHISTPIEAGRAVSVSAFRAGDVAYSPGEESVVVFLADGSSATGAGLVLVGHVDGEDLSQLSNCVQRCEVRLAPGGSDAG
jgi:hypothetical protein